MIVDSDLLQRKWARRVPPVIDTILLASAIFLSVTIHQYPFVHAWLTAKVVGLFIYIGLGIAGADVWKNQNHANKHLDCCSTLFYLYRRRGDHKKPPGAIVKKITCPAFIMSLCALLVACGNPNQRLDEYVFYEGPQFRLKVVRYYRNIPFNQLGEQAVVMCQSENTAQFPAHDQQDAGWRMLGAEDAQESKSAADAALSMQDDYEVFDDHILIAKINVFNISFDACGHFINWDPSHLPQAMIDPVEKPDSCAPNGPADCRYLDFEGDRAPRYEQISVAGDGQVSFTVRSKTFTGVELLSVQTSNNGAVWHVETVGPDKQRLKPDTIRSLPMPSLEKEMTNISLMDWLESALPSHSMVIWPDVLTTCGDQYGTEEQSSSTPCAEIRFNDIEGNSGALYIAINTDSENRVRKAVFHSGVYSSGDNSRPAGSLAGLREMMVAGKK